MSGSVFVAADLNHHAMPVGCTAMLDEAVASAGKFLASAFGRALLAELAEPQDLACGITSRLFGDDPFCNPISRVKGVFGPTRPVCPVTEYDLSCLSGCAMADSAPLRNMSVATLLVL
jgi:hypothetical protein